ncbi:hypothetical protein E4U44_008480, partial [Claviceps purpurea]
MDKEFVGAEARSRFQTATTPILSPQDLDTYADWIVDELTKIATLAVPKKPHGRPRQRPWWNDKVQSAVAGESGAASSETVEQQKNRGKLETCPRGGRRANQSDQGRTTQLVAERDCSSESRTQRPLGTRTLGKTSKRAAPRVPADPATTPY